MMPPIGLLLGGVDFSNLFLVLNSGAGNPGFYAALADAQIASAVSINYGVSMNSMISFLIMAFALFLLIRGINTMRRQTDAPPAEPTTKPCSYCTGEIPLRAWRSPPCTADLAAA